MIINRELVVLTMAGKMIPDIHEESESYHIKLAIQTILGLVQEREYGPKWYLDDLERLIARVIFLEGEPK